MMKIENIIVEYPDKGLTTISASDFFSNVCEEEPSPLIRILNGQLYEQDSVKYCIRADDIELDAVANVWLRG